MTRLLYLLQIIFSAHAFAQDTLAVVDLKNGAGFAQVLFSNDTMLVRVFNDPMKTAYRGSVAAWYSPTQKFGEPDLKAIGSTPVMEVRRYGSFSYYYTAEQQGKKTMFKVFGSNDNQPAAELKKYVIEGTPVADIDRGKTFILATWKRKESTVYLSEFMKDQLVATQKVYIPIDLHDVQESDIVFLGPGSSEGLGVIPYKMKFFLHDDTFGAVIDDQFESYFDDESLFTTTAFRRNLKTGKEDIDVFYTNGEYSFKSYLKDTVLYRLTSDENTAKLTIHDLNANKVIQEMDLNKMPQLQGYDRLPAINKLFLGDVGTLNGIRASSPKALALAVDDHDGKHIVSVGYHTSTQNTSNYRSIPLAFPLAGGFLYMSIPLKNPDASLSEHPHHLKYAYLVGSPTEEFVPIKHGSESTFVKIRRDEFEAAWLPRINLDLAGHHVGPRFWVGIYSTPKSSEYYVLKFDVK